MACLTWLIKPVPKPRNGSGCGNTINRVQAHGCRGGGGGGGGGGVPEAHCNV